MDLGNLSDHLANNYEDAEVSGFSLPDWDFNDKEVRQEFIELLREVSPDAVWLAPSLPKVVRNAKVESPNKCPERERERERLKTEVQ